jgi:uncharacterized protein
MSEPMTQPLVGLAVTHRGQSLQLLPSAAIFWPRESMLLVADAHIGKDQSFRRLGMPVPSGVSQGTLARLSTDLALTGAQQLVFLGDFLHSAHAQAASTQAELRAWRARHPELACTLVRGNHDDHAGDPSADLAFVVRDEPWLVGPFALRHHPEPDLSHYSLAGHWHPCVRVGRGRERLRLPCFWFGAQVGVLPAYGEFTGMHPIERAAGDAIWAIADDSVVAIPAA